MELSGADPLCPDPTTLQADRFLSKPQFSTSQIEFVPPGGIYNAWRHLLLSQLGWSGELLASRERGRVLQYLRCTEWSPPQRTALAQTAAVPRLRKPVLSSAALTWNVSVSALDRESPEGRAGLGLVLGECW